MREISLLQFLIVQARQRQIALRLLGTLLWLSVFSCSLAVAVQNNPNIPDTDLPSGPCAEGARLFQARDYAAAHPQLLRCLEGGNEGLSVLVPLTVIAVMAGDAPAGILYGQRAVTQAPQDVDARYWYGRALLLSGDAAAAEAQWQAGLQQSDSHLGILEALARLAMDSGQDAKAYGLLVHLQRQGLDEGWIHKLQSELARRKGLWRQARDHWLNGIGRDGESADDLLIAGELSIMAGEPAVALGFGRRAVQLAPSGATYGGLGEAYFAADMYDSALTALRRAVELDPTLSHHRFNLANLLEINGLIEEAEVHFEVYVAAVPNDPLGHLNYALHLQKRGRIGAALEPATAAVRLDSDLLMARVVLGQLLEALGRYDEAIAVVTQLQAREQEQSPKLANWLARLEMNRSETVSARQAGKVRLLHIVTADSTVIAQIDAELTAGIDFAQVAMRYSVGSAAVRGGDIGWVVPTEMVEPLQSTIQRLQPGDVSSVVKSRGQFHLFKRLQ